ncbi:proline-rich protein 36-like [Sceloporus undulatus]|uniref:proline-rich protein 36-like n=1 Tax=Sceloporus undulatus TaxID=8520 RepID=UPI001C4D5C86|nr:proline-rich protein 36-like [Sceloporus undulatus]
MLYSTFWPQNSWILCWEMPPALPLCPASCMALPQPAPLLIALMPPLKLWLILPLSLPTEQQEVAASASQHSHSPRDFFQQRERLGSALEQPSSPGGQPGVPRRPFLRIQRSLTESSYIFRRPDPSQNPSSSGGFLPSGPSPGAAPLPSSHQPKLPPPISPKPGPGALPRIPVPETRASPTPLPPENGTLPVTGSSPMVATTSPLAEVSTPERGGGGGEGSPFTPPPELGPPSPPASTEVAPHLGDPPQASSLPPPHSLSDSPQAKAAPLGPVSSSQAESLPHRGTPSPSPCSPDHLMGPSQAEGQGSPSLPTNGFPQEESLATGDPPAPSHAELAPSSGPKGMMGAEEEGALPMSHGLGTGEQVDSPAGAKLPGAALGDLGTGVRTQTDDQPSLVECIDHAGDPTLQAAEA